MADISLPRYRVLARKYRPATLDGLIGQDALVRTLTNAIATGRLAQAYMLSGVRGVGKTTTARIIARTLNCIGPDGTGGVTATPCGVCDHCVAIAEDRHLDVIEMDAASHTGIENMRELLDGVPYRPTMARFKVYIIDEVHMLSEKAFNALLKTLEEPPEHVKFIFATTEIRKVPVTVLSRCQRFDLRRVDAETLRRHLASVAQREDVVVAPEALQMLARAADGSVRDALSLLDQAIAHGGGRADAPVVREMLGLADRAVCFDILDAVMRGDALGALAVLQSQYDAGADPASLLEDILGLVHWLTRVKLAPACADAIEIPETERVRGRVMADSLSMADVTRAWQMLLKGLGETRVAPSPLHAAEMVLIRLAYAADLPSPADAVRALADPAPTADGLSPPPSTTPATKRPVASVPARGTATVRLNPTSQPAPETNAVADGDPVKPPQPASFEEVVELAMHLRQGILQSHLLADVHLVRFEPGRIELRLGDRAPVDLAQRLSGFLLEATGQRWMVIVSLSGGAPSLHDQRRAEHTLQLEQVAQHPLVRAILETFPGTGIAAVRRPEPAPEGCASESAED